MGRGQHIAPHVTHPQHHAFRDTLGAHNEPGAHLFGRLERAFDDIAGHCHTIAGHLPSGFEGIRYRTAHEIDNLCLNLIDALEAPHETLFDRGASATNGPAYPCVRSCFFCHTPPPMAYCPRMGKRASEQRSVFVTFRCENVLYPALRK